MDARLDYNDSKILQKFVKHINSAGAAVTSALPPGTANRPIREVVLPASVVLAWSLFVLAAIALSFLAGLLVGHFLWKAV